MKIKDLLEFNPEAEIEIIMSNCLSFNDKIDLGWTHDEGECEDPKKETAKTVYIILGNFKENKQN